MLELSTLYLSVLASTAPLVVVFIVVERLRPAERGQPLRPLLRNLAYYPPILAFVMVLGHFASPLYAWLLARSGGGLVGRWLPAPRGLGGEIAASLLYAFVWDVWQYGVHRWQHASPLLWRAHRLHHAEATMNASSHARHHPAHHLMNLVLYLPLFLLLGGLTPHAVCGFILFRLWGFVSHSNLRLGLGRATPLVVGPQWHRIHHSVRPEHQDRNFATFFPVIDLLFGTYYAPAADEYPATGLTREAA